jgi:hypothetical protein
MSYLRHFMPFVVMFFYKPIVPMGLNFVFVIKILRTLIRLFIVS